MTTLGLLVSVNSLYKGIWWYNGNTASGDVAMASIYSYTGGNYSKEASYMAPYTG